MCVALFLRKKSWRSKWRKSNCSGSVICGSLPSPYALRKTTNGHRISGSRDNAAGPKRSLFTGICLQPSTRRPSSSAICSNCSVDFLRTSVFGLKNRLPAAYIPCGGRPNPVSRAKFLTKNLWGMEVITPAPSPSRASEPTAPRWVMLHSRLCASLMILWLATPRIEAANPTPQASFSYSGSYKPTLGGRAPAHEWF